MARWWDADASERYWVEIRKLDGIGTELTCPTTQVGGAKDPWYELVASVRAGDVIYHWSAREHRFVGRSVAAKDAVEDQDQQAYRVELTDFRNIVADVSLAELRGLASDVYDLRDRLSAEHDGPLHLPFQFTTDRSQFRFMSNYFAKLPKELVTLLFGPDGLADDRVATLTTATTSSTSATAPAAHADGGARGFLGPFKPKADTNYRSKVAGGTFVRDKSHETLVNNCAAWLTSKGLQPGCNAAVDLGLEHPAVVIEAKIIYGPWAPSLRQAVGQLYEYRYFKVSDPKSELIVLADLEVPQHWVDYLERDRAIGVMWPDGVTFAMSDRARSALGL